MTISQIATLLEIDRTTVSRWIRIEGVEPVGTAGRAADYRFLDVLSALPPKTLGLKESELNLRDENARLRILQQERLQLELQLQRKELLTTDEVVQELSNLVLAFKAGMLALPRTVAPAVASESDVFIVERLIKDRVTDALTELASGAEAVVHTAEGRVLLDTPSDSASDKGESRA